MKPHLSPRRLLAAGLIAWTCALATQVVAQPRKMVAVLDATQGFGTTKRAVNFYDVTDLSGSSVFGQQPLFSVWTGFEDSITNNYEDPGTIAVNPANGTVYVAAFDSGTIGNVDLAGDHEGDYDLYRIDYQEALNDFLTNGRPMGQMYAPTVGPDGGMNIAHPDHSGSTIFLDGISKIGEVSRAQSSTFFDYDLEFVNPESLVLLDNQTGANPGENDPIDVANDHQIRLINRVSTSPNSATYNATTNEGGFNNGTTESWESNIGAFVDMDGGFSLSNPEDLAFVRRDGVIGVWVGESDAGGDDVSFFELDFSAMTATKKEFQVGTSPYATGFALDEDPTVNPASNDGDHDFIVIDGSGNLVIGESGFFESPQEEPKLIGREILDYDAADTDANGQNEIIFGGWSTSANLPSPTNDDDTGVTDGRFATIDKGTGYVYFFDVDGGGAPDVVADVYVFDPATGLFVYQEQNAANHFTEQHGIRFFLRGDINDDGVLDGADLSELAAAISDPTLGGTVSAVVGGEWYDLTGDSVLTNDDLVELQNLIGTTTGDFDNDGDVDGADFLAWQRGFPGTFDADDLSDWQAAYSGGELTGQVAAVPEPASLLMAGLGLLALSAKRRASV